MDALCESEWTRQLMFFVLLLSRSLRTLCIFTFNSFVYAGSLMAQFVVTQNYHPALPLAFDTSEMTLFFVETR